VGTGGGGAKGGRGKAGEGGYVRVGSARDGHAGPAGKASGAHPILPLPTLTLTPHSAPASATPTGTPQNENACSCGGGVAEAAVPAASAEAPTVAPAEAARPATRAAWAAIRARASAAATASWDTRAGLAGTSLESVLHAAHKNEGRGSQTRTPTRTNTGSRVGVRGQGPASRRAARVGAAAKQAPQHPSTPVLNAPGAPRRGLVTGAALRRQRAHKPRQVPEVRAGLGPLCLPAPQAHVGTELRGDREKLQQQGKRRGRGSTAAAGAGKGLAQACGPSRRMHTCFSLRENFTRGQERTAATQGLGASVRRPTPTQPHALRTPGGDSNKAQSATVPAHHNTHSSSSRHLPHPPPQNTRKNSPTCDTRVHNRTLADTCAWRTWGPRRPRGVPGRAVAAYGGACRVRDGRKVLGQVHRGGHGSQRPQGLLGDVRLLQRQHLLALLQRCQLGRSACGCGMQGRKGGEAGRGRRKGGGKLTQT
jgi:hypothetical protein